jgi:hypothetical protein
MRAVLMALICAIILSGCSDGEPSDTGSEIQRYPDVIGVEVTETAENVYSFDVTMSSPYDTPQRYADAWRVRGEDGTVYGIRELLHDHASEQPFTRSLSDVAIPEGTATVIVEGRDQEHGWGGETAFVELP